MWDYQKGYHSVWISRRLTEVESFFQAKMCQKSLLPASYFQVFSLFLCFVCFSNSMFLCFSLSVWQMKSLKRHNSPVFHHIVTFSRLISNLLSPEPHWHRDRKWMWMLLPLSAALCLLPAVFNVVTLSEGSQWRQRGRMMSFMSDSLFSFDSSHHWCHSCCWKNTTFL